MSARHGAPQVVLFCGSREWTNAAAIRSDLESLPEGSIVIEGGARGADAIARREAASLGLHVATMRAQWDHYGKSAGYRRNEAMARLQPSFVYAYPLGGAGTEHMIRIAERDCIQVRER
jgi:YspA, cpYpsA-related SLOG family